MKNLTFLLLIATSLGVHTSLNAQNDRINMKEQIGWYNVFLTIKLNQKWGIHAEYQWRRMNYISNWQQSLARTGINYALSPNLQLRLGYAFIGTFAYGEYPINAMGKPFSEHRFFQMLQQNTTEGKVGISHRLMFEQRLVGKYSNASSTHEDQFVFMNRLRYMLRLQMPLVGNVIKPKVPYLAVYDELFMGFGKNVRENVFDQNRIGLLAGYVLSNHFRIEGGYLNQILQLGREVNGRNVFQHNNGIIVNTIFNLDYSK